MIDGYRLLYEQFKKKLPVYIEYEWFRIVGFLAMLFWDLKFIFNTGFLSQTAAIQPNLIRSNKFNIVRSSQYLDEQFPG